MRYLTSALVAEGESDELFLEQVLFRQLNALAFAAQDPFEVGTVLIAQCRTVMLTKDVQSTCADLARFCDLVFVHHDDNERGKIVPLARSETVGSRLVHLVPIRETEAWMISDREALAAFRGSDCSQLPDAPAKVEQIVDPKAALRSALGRRPWTEVFRSIGLNVSLDRLAQVPAYRTFLDDLITALKELNFR